ncbi:MAG TPA: TIM barrel protein, partial [Streptosporangiaceae bacterium]|nr:TIM barrel protein [Streptosporangiaceae bacterium]
EVSDVGMCLETGHMLLGGGDPVAMLRDLGDRVNHVHLKDARLPVMAKIIADEAPVTEIWTREAFCALGGGDLDADAVLDGLRRISFGGWLVVEQDILPRSAERFARAAAEQRHNREFLTARGLLEEHCKRSTVTRGESCHHATVRYRTYWCRAHGPHPSAGPSRLRRGQSGRHRGNVAGRPRGRGRDGCGGL